MDQLETELDFHVTDFVNQIDHLGTPTTLSSHYADTDDGEFALGSSGNGTPALDPAGDAVFAEELPANAAVEYAATVTVEAAGSGPVKRKRGRPRKNPDTRAAPPAKKKEQENVCFVCFDQTNPNLVSCNKRGCYKAYHPACVNLDEAFLHSKAKWNCGWHICSNCQKAAHYLCCTCTASYCKECITDESKFVCVRGTYGFCQSCHNTVTLIELNKLAVEKKVDSDFGDTDSFTYLFKSYWLDQKERLSMTSEELSNARHPYFVALDEESSDDLYDVNEDHGSSSESSSGHHKSNISSKKKTKNRSQAFIADKIPAKEVDSGGAMMLRETGWASKELLELVAHMRNGDQSFISQFEVQALLLDYIKKYNLRDPRRKSQIICDLRLRNLFGKERVGHFEMLKLLELHFLSKEVPQLFVDGDQAEASDLDNKVTDDVEEGDIFVRPVSEKRRKNRKRNEEIEPQTNIDDYAAVDVHNVTQIFLRRGLVEDLLDDIETFNEKVVGSFVRIRISNAGQRQDLYRLVQVIGTQENPKPYKVGKKTTAIVLEILNLDKKETSTIDSISNQDFTEEECQRLRQSIKCGLIDRLKVGYIQEKAKVLHAVRVNDSIEAEKLRLSHLRDRASETGRRKQLRECVEKLQLLNNPEERRRRLNEVPHVHADPKMDPEYESSEEVEDDKNEASSLRKKRELIPRGRAGTNWNGMPRGSNFSRSMQGEVGQDRWGVYNNFAEKPNGILLNPSMHQSEANFTDLPTVSPRNSASKSLEQPYSVAPDVNPVIPNEVDKIWHYVDPSNNIQGPFSLTQLRKWSTTGYFPPDMRTWRTSEKQEDSCLLADVLSGRFYPQHSSFPHQQNRSGRKLHPNISQPTSDGLPSESPAWSAHGAGPVYNNPHQNPTYEETGRRGGSVGWKQEQDYGNMWSPTRPHVGTLNVENKLMADSSILPGASTANEQNSSMTTYRTFESDCPSPTPRAEKNMDISQGIGHTAGTSGSSLSSHPAIINFEPSNTNPAEEFSHNEMQKLASSEFPNKFSPTAATSDDIGIPNVGTGQSMDHAAFQKSFPFVGNPSPPLLHQAQNPNPNFLHIHQPSPLHSTTPLDSSLPSPTPKSNIQGTDPSIPATQQGNPGWGAVANTGWETPGQMAANVHTGWANPIQNSQASNPGWGTPVQVNSNPGWGTPLQVNASTNTGWGTPVQANTSSNAGWGMPVQGNANGWGTTESIPTHEDDSHVRAGWGSSFVSKNGNGNVYSRQSGGDPWTNRSQSGGRGFPSQAHQLPPGGDRHRGVCKFYENGHCKKGRYCTFMHVETKRGIR